MPKNVNEGNPDFTQASTRDEGVYAMEDDYGTSYYYRGAVENNYVKFAGYYWRIIRINGDGSIRIQYDGTKAHPNGEISEDRVALSNIEWNSGISTYDAKYVGYMYGESSDSYDQAIKNDINSTIKVQIDNWYENHLANTEYTKYIVDSVFCNDREIETDLISNNSGYYKSYTTLGYGNNPTLYKAASRVGVSVPNPQPSLKCTQKNDSFTINKEKGNGMLTYPIGMITIDEITAAGRGLYSNTNNRYYLYKGITYWTISPHNYWNGYPYMSRSEDNDYRIVSNAVSPVINLKPEYAREMTGDGTINNPYRVK